MKKKMVVKVSMKDDKSRSKALQIAVCISGVESAALAGADKDQVVVVGEDIDAVALTRHLRKNIGFTELVSVGEDKKDAPPAAAAAANVEAAPPQSTVVWAYPPQYSVYPVHEMVAGPPEQTCTIM